MGSLMLRSPVMGSLVLRSPVMGSLVMGSLVIEERCRWRMVECRGRALAVLEVGEEGVRRVGVTGTDERSPPGGACVGMRVRAWQCTR